jgi:hypothetical protein
LGHRRHVALRQRRGKHPDSAPSPNGKHLIRGEFGPEGTSAHVWEVSSWKELLSRTDGAHFDDQHRPVSRGSAAASAGSGAGPRFRRCGPRSSRSSRNGRSNSDGARPLGPTVAAYTPDPYDDILAEQNNNYAPTVRAVRGRPAAGDETPLINGLVAHTRWLQCGNSNHNPAPLPGTNTPAPPGDPQECKTNFYFFPTRFHRIDG